MPKKDFELIARVFDNAWHDTREERRLINAVARDMADALAATNPRFDRARFLEACGVETGADDSHAERKLAKRRENS